MNVYFGDWESRKPEVGRGLNKAAEIALLDVKPETESGGPPSQSELNTFIQTLQAYSQYVLRRLSHLSLLMRLVTDPNHLLPASFAPTFVLAVLAC